MMMPQSKPTSNFNPRAPCGARREIFLIDVSVISISIHAPLAGCDQLGAHFSPKSSHISIHAPLAGCDLTADDITADKLAFQSTHPLRGATVHHRPAGLVGGISIHAPLAGCDFGHYHDNKAVDISIHAPHAGRDIQLLCTSHP